MYEAQTDSDEQRNMMAGELRAMGEKTVDRLCSGAQTEYALCSENRAKLRLDCHTITCNPDGRAILFDFAHSNPGDFVNR